MKECLGDSVYAENKLENDNIPVLILTDGDIVIRLKTDIVSKLIEFIYGNHVLCRYKSGCIGSEEDVKIYGYCGDCLHRIWKKENCIWVCEKIGNPIYPIGCSGCGRGMND